LEVRSQQASLVPSRLGACGMNTQSQANSANLGDAAARPLRPLLPAASPRSDAPPSQSKRARVSLACGACRTRKTKVRTRLQCRLGFTGVKNRLMRLCSATASVPSAANACRGTAAAYSQRRRLHKRSVNIKISRSCLLCSSRYRAKMHLSCLGE
jgi:hypothetical protein